jgi:hypothetical protein
MPLGEVVAGDACSRCSEFVPHSSVLIASIRARQPSPAQSYATSPPAGLLWDQPHGARAFAACVRKGLLRPAQREREQAA